MYTEATISNASVAGASEALWLVYSRQCMCVSIIMRICMSVDNTDLSKLVATKC